MMLTNVGKLMTHKKQIIDVKKLVNCILENGAYSNKNEKMQIAKGINSYNPQEKILVQTSWKFRKFHGLIMQQQLKEFFEGDKHFLSFLEKEDNELYSKLLELKL